MTGQRQVILEELRKVTVHPTADEIFAMVRRVMPHISLATVYRNLEILSSLGLVQKLECAGSQRRYDGNPERHHHIRCIGCGSVNDVSSEAVTDFEYIPERIPGYQVLNYSFMFIGLCDACGISGVKHEESLENGEENDCGYGHDRKSPKGIPAFSPILRVKENKKVLRKASPLLEREGTGS